MISSLAITSAVFLFLASDVSISKAERDDDGFLVHRVESPYQSSPTTIRVLVPDKVADGARLPVVYVLPVEAGDESRYGNGLRELKKHDLHNKRRAIFVAPTFSHLPWYADHPTKNDLRQESYLLRVVVPFVDANYPSVQERDGRLLLGFSKSGWGAWTLLLRNPDVFGRAAAWDAPLMMQRRGMYGNGPIFGTQENFERYRLTDLLRASAKSLHAKDESAAPRLVLTGYGSFRQHHEEAHALLEELRIPHVYEDGPKRRHDWHSGWAVEAAVHLLSGTEAARRKGNIE